MGFVNARSAIRFVIERTGTSTFWIPSYICPAVLAAVPAAGVEVRFFPVNAELRVSSWNWLDSAREGHLAILVRYFGLSLDPDECARIRRHGLLLIEDACQALFSDPESSPADFLVYSPRKFVGVPDGGLLVHRREWAAEMEPPPAVWWLGAFEAVRLRRDFDQYAAESPWFERFREAEAGQPVGPFRMSDLSAALLRHAVDYEAAAERRRANYSALAEQLPEVALFPTLSDGAVPLGFPIQVPRRDSVLEFLFHRRIYPPVHWNLAGCIPPRFEDSHRLAGRVMTLPCDQRYGTEEMDRMAAAVRQALEQ